MTNANQNIEITKLVESFKRGDLHALDELYAFFQPRLFNFSKGFLKVEDDINDILQEVFVKIWTNRRGIKNSETFNAYIFTITRNAIVSYFREKIQLPDFEQSVKAAAVVSETDILKDIEYKELKERIDNLVIKLPEKRKNVFKLSRYEGLSNKEIASKLNISIKTVEDHITHSLKFLRKEMKDVGILATLFFSIFL
ncbi:RNA polymerase sigma-70 factor [uncultured Draconibacterium sp.]|uniref:RNA polymerase sigma-70 factor n=1 Tax=uncultured Draconibacterium sp. TaxID=1573823 RepID=UPI0029C886AA|nr:RNA polymerase sigma-70 factor [uncultured Draconibacterium sp.]